MQRKTLGLVVAAAVFAATAGAATFIGLSGKQGRLADGLRGPVQATASALGIRQSAAVASIAAGSAVQAPAGPASAERQGRGTYIVVFREAALAGYKGDLRGMPAPQRVPSRSGKLRMDVHGGAAQAYVGYLKQRQSRHAASMASLLGRGIVPRATLQHALNGMVVDLTPDEAGRIGRLREVLLVEAYREDPLDTDVGPALIGAPPVWSGAAAGTPYQGEGVVFGIIDSGINFGSPSFAAVDPIDGYIHANPLGAGNFLGTCQPGEVDAGRCNAKLIGGYDFVCGPPANQCGQPNIREEPGFGDTDGHGTHTASTAAGNRRDVVFNGAPRRISGVAPRGNVVAYDVCYHEISTGRGLCPNTSTALAVNQTVADGIIDVINYSIGGGTQPWVDTISLAFRNASDAGIYVAASAGNSGPGPNTMGHLQPWVSSTAAAQHGRGSFAFLMQVTGPTPVPPALTAIVVTPGSGGAPHNASLTAPLRVSPGIDTVDDGCAAFPAGAFTGAIAVIRRGTCSFVIKTDNAAAAGAIAIVIANNQPGVIIPAVPGTTIPAFSILQSDGNALRDFHTANPTATAQIGFPAVALPNTADALAAFSSRGPAGSFNLLKPDITAPGVQVLAAYAGDSIDPQFDNLVNSISGTSMASPHQAGAAGLVRQARPGWTVPEIKSALAMTAKQPVFLEDQVTVAGPFARGAGRVQVDRAVNAGLLLDETTANYIAANPASGGDPSTLNQPSFAHGRCPTPCRFTRTFRNPHATGSTWEPRIGGGLRGTASPLLLRVPAGGEVTVTFTIDPASLPADGVWRFGQASLLPLGKSDRVPLHLPIAVAVQPPLISIPALVNVSAPSGGTGTGSTSVANVGGGLLDFSVDNTGSGSFLAYDANSAGSSSGYRSAFYTNPQTFGPAQFASDDFTVSTPMQVTFLLTEGFNFGGSLAGATDITWAIYPDDNGNPAGNPQSAPGAAVWSYTAAPNSAGVDVTGNFIRLNLAAAGQTVTLAPGRYWLVVAPRQTFANRWVWFGAPTGSPANPAQGNGSWRVITPGNDGLGAWVEVTTDPVNAPFGGLAMRVVGSVGCGAPWLGAFSPSTGSVAGGASATLSFQVSPSVTGTRVLNGYYCISSNDATRPKATGAVRVQVN